MTRIARNRGAAAILFAVAAAIPLVVRDAFILDSVILILLWGSLSAAWNVAGGYAGQVSLGHAAFFGIGAYAAGLTSARYEQVGVNAGNGWQRQENGGLWRTDWFGRAQAAVVYILVNDYHEAMYFIRATDSGGAMLEGRNTYTMTFPKGELPPVDRKRGGFWSLTMYDKDYFMLPNPPNGRTNIGTVSLDANELKFAADGSLTITMSHEQPADTEARANWLPAPEGQFALIVRAYVPTQAILDGSYKLPNVERK